MPMNGQWWTSKARQYPRVLYFFPSVHLGSCAIHNFSAHIPDHYKQSDLPLIGTASKECILGNSALSNVVVTIDYPKHLITFQPPQQKPMPDAERTGTSYRFTWSDSEDFGNYGGPIIKGDSYHHRLNMLFDTGCGNVYIISPALEHDLLKSGNTSLLAQQVKTNTMYDFMGAELTKPMIISLPSDIPSRVITLRLYARAAPAFSEPTSAAIGGFIFRQFVITIDYPHRIITLALPKRS